MKKLKFNFTLRRILILLGILIILWLVKCNYEAYKLRVVKCVEEGNNFNYCKQEMKKG